MTGLLLLVSVYRVKGSTFLDGFVYSPAVRRQWVTEMRPVVDAENVSVSQVAMRNDPRGATVKLLANGRREHNGTDNVRGLFYRPVNNGEGILRRVSDRT